MIAFDQIVDSLINTSPIRVTEEQFDKFEYEFIIYALRGVPYGRAFCQYFNIDPEGHYIIWNMQSTDLAREWIKNNYIV